LYNLAKELGIEALIEIHDEKDLEKAIKADAKLIGINNRDLTSFNTNLSTTVRLSKLIPKGILTISESGISSEEDIVYLKDGNVDGILVGEAFIKSDSVSELARSFKNA
jgi:indole-3-glycerol phosphate synthase